MNYFVTGATGFIGKRLVQRLVERGGTVFVLVRARSRPKYEQLLEFCGASSETIIPITGDLAESGLGVSEADRRRLTGTIDHCFHLAAIYDLKASAESQQLANIDGTRHLVELANDLNVGCLHLVSSIAAAGLYPGVFREDMFDEAEDLDHPYFRTKHESEGIVRREARVPWRIYRPGFAVGDSNTGVMDKIDGPYYFFKLIQKTRQLLPPWAPIVGLEGGRFNLVPVDYVVAAMDHIAHVPGEDNRCFHLVDSHPHRFGEILNIFAKAAHAPEMALRVNARVFDIIPPALLRTLGGLEPIQRVTNELLRELDLPPDVFQFLNWPTRYDDRETQRLLAGSGIQCPELQDYAWRLWDYWERHLDPDLFIDRSLAGQVKDRVVVITGASSGIGKATAFKLAEAGAKVVLAARGVEKLEQTKTEIEEKGGTAFIYSADLSDMEDCDRFVGQVLNDHGQIDILINNVGRSIRRSINHSYDRFHDFERTMQLNYFGCLRVTMGVLPSMEQRGRGHVVNISSIGVLSNAPRFSAYVASKAALEAFSRCAGAELADSGIDFTTINMPLVRTPMIAPTQIYQSVPTLTPEQAADLVARAIIEKPERLATRLGKAAQVAHAVSPRMMQTLMNTAFRMFPESSAALGQHEAMPEESRPSQEQLLLANLMRGLHW
ncbi:SDR family oxidoreductase [Saccharospirillum salsuginis]|uniref:Short chain dehydrogenase n=1 Tax=Saccharospirillum salsuginis TaxID=418750 RepID=A0A918K850_9GAMM|nr:SDR family oxidoreductase [Saccharospirillum salsuginis]GGX52392.1 short chain dehydrogenase [Saccharospirillum salsuginis]